MRRVATSQALLIVSIVVAFGLAVSDAAAEGDFHTRYRALLQRHTVETTDTVQVRVNYAALERDLEWHALVDALEDLEPDQLTSRSQRLAFWINAYNIFAIELVRAHLPVKSIRKIGPFYRSVWDEEVGMIAGRTYTLGEIEHEILRPMGEPRIHGAIVCASVSCPPLSREPYTAENIDAELDAALRVWLANTKKGARYDHASKTLTLSKVFDWFEGDFAKGGGVVDFVARYLPASDAAELRESGLDVSLRYFDYDWALND